jgi:hypothetical protein
VITFNADLAQSTDDLREGHLSLERFDAEPGRNLVTLPAAPGRLLIAMPTSTSISAPLPHRSCSRRAGHSKLRVIDRSNHLDRNFSEQSIRVDNGFTSE